MYYKGRETSQPLMKVKLLRENYPHDPNSLMVLAQMPISAAGVQSTTAHDLLSPPHSGKPVSAAG